jgi:hypothetical protein
MISKSLGLTDMGKKELFSWFSVFLLLSSCSSIPINQPWKEGRWNIYGFFDPEQDVRITDFYDDYEPETNKYKAEDLFWYRKVDRGDTSIDEFLESEAVYLGQKNGSIQFCTSNDMEGLYDTDTPSRNVFMQAQDIQKFTRNLEKYTVLKIKYRYFYRPAYVPKGQSALSITNRRVSQAKTQGLMGISEFFLDEYEILGKLDVPQSQISKGIQRVGDIFSAVVRGTDRAIGKLLGIDDVIPEGEITLENGLKYQKVGLGEIAKKAKTYKGPDLFLTSRVKLSLFGDRGNNVWAFREAEGSLVQTMKYTGHIPSGMSTLRIYYRLRNGGVFEVDEVKQASIFNDQW